MDSIVFAGTMAVLSSSAGVSIISSRSRSLPCIPTCSSSSPVSRLGAAGGGCYASSSRRRLLRFYAFGRSDASLFATNGSTNSVSPREGTYTVGDFMTRKEHLHVVKPTTTVDEALETLVNKRVTGFPVVDDDWKLVGVVSDYDLLALDSISGGGQQDTSMFPVVGSTWKTFNELQKLLSKTNGKVIGDLMTSAPLVVRETTNLEDAARLLLKTKFRRLPVVDSEGKLIGIITRGDIVGGALQMKKETENL
ncbi:CBS domain-containing protein CBSX1, chloroplastic-like [Andrographis paniculata]|uniref:CBS domain-containing protein CBSX1, chloroplastic-like n=1 Tax=Andrographis paniculata TaxID=175694 RepID=UPI0021E9203E|nr:CBS domain-containing protein CBSX1, chloroplastic-like [Andrographis paniculata]